MILCFSSTHFQLREEKNGRIFGNGAKLCTTKIRKKIFVCENIENNHERLFQKEKASPREFEIWLLSNSSFCNYGFAGTFVVQIWIVQMKFRGWVWIDSVHQMYFALLAFWMINSKSEAENGHVKYSEFNRVH